MSRNPRLLTFDVKNPERVSFDAKEAGAPAELLDLMKRLPKEVGDIAAQILGEKDTDRSILRIRAMANAKGKGIAR